MSDMVRESPAAPEDAAVMQRLSTLDQFLPAWIIVAMWARRRYYPTTDGNTAATIK